MVIFFKQKIYFFKSNCYSTRPWRGVWNFIILNRLCQTHLDLEHTINHYLNFSNFIICSLNPQILFLASKFQQIGQNSARNFIWPRIHKNIIKITKMIKTKFSIFGYSWVIFLYYQIEKYEFWNYFVFLIALNFYCGNLQQ